MSKTNLEEENRQLRQKLKALEEQLYTIYKEHDQNSDDKLVTDYQKQQNQKITN